MIVITNPDNPTGTVASKSTLLHFQEICKKHSIWFVLDNTYEYFIYDTINKPFVCIEDSNIINIFSFSKAYGMMGWRMGYIAYCNAQVDVTNNTEWSLEAQLLKCQDTIPICPTIISQHVALGALQEAGVEWVQLKLKEVKDNQQLIRNILIELVGEENVFGGDGAIYLFVKLPMENDMLVVEELALKHGIVVIPGTACGASGHIRISYANLVHEKCKVAAEKLKVGLTEVLGL